MQTARTHTFSSLRYPRFQSRVFWFCFVYFSSLLLFFLLCKERTSDLKASNDLKRSFIRWFRWIYSLIIKRVWKNGCVHDAVSRLFTTPPTLQTERARARACILHPDVLELDPPALRAPKWHCQQEAAMMWCGAVAKVVSSDRERWSCVRRAPRMVRNAARVVGPANRSCSSSNSNARSFTSSTCCMHSSWMNLRLPPPT